LPIGVFKKCVLDLSQNMFTRAIGMG